MGSTTAAQCWCSPGLRTPAATGIQSPATAAEVPGGAAGADLRMRPEGERILLADADGCVVAQLSAKAAAGWRERLSAIRRVRVLAMYVRRRRDVPDPDFAVHLRSDEWEVPLCEVAYAAGRRTVETGS